MFEIRFAPKPRRLAGAALVVALLNVSGCGGAGHASSQAVADVADGAQAQARRPPSAVSSPTTSSKPTSAPASTAAYDAAGWSVWQRQATPVYSGPYGLVGDPSVMRDGTLLRMFHTCYDVVRQGPAICQVTSTDGENWAPVPVQDPLPGRMLQTRPGQWDDTHETPLAIKFNGEYLLYYAGYRNKGGHLNSTPIQMGLATSGDGVNFTPVSDQPIFTVSPIGFDSDAAFSPSIVEHQGRLVMLYTAYCMATCARQAGVYLMAATSTDGRHWTKLDLPVISRSQLPAGVKDIAEAHVGLGPDGQYYLFATYLYESGQGHEIGIGRAGSPLGPWQLSPTPVVRRMTGGFDDVGPIAPSVLIEGDVVRMWFHGFSSEPKAQIGLARATWPLFKP